MQSADGKYYKTDVADTKQNAKILSKKSVRKIEE